MADKGWRGSVAAGFVVYRQSAAGVVEFLNLKASYGSKHWTPPKGHVDPGENEFETAVRETEEEAGFNKDHYDVDPDFKKELHYLVAGKEKTVHYWLAKLKDGVAVTLSDEHTEHRWEQLEQAKVTVGYTDSQSLLEEASQHIASKQS